MRQTRFGVRSSTPTKYGDLKTLFEFELFGTGVDAGQTTFRLRQAYGELGQFGAGQTWSPFMDIDVLTVGIAVGSSQQIALFVAPALVLLSYAVAPKPMNLGFGNAGLAIIFLAVLITAMISSDGKSNWFKGVQLLCVYALIALCCYFLPDTLVG